VRGCVSRARGEVVVVVGPPGEKEWKVRSENSDHREESILVCVCKQREEEVRLKTLDVRV